MDILLLGKAETFFHRQAFAEVSLCRNETIWRVRTLLAQPSPIGTSGRVQNIVPCGCLFPLAGNWQVGGTLGRVVPPARQSCLPRRSPPPTPDSVHPTNLAELRNGLF